MIGELVFGAMIKELTVGERKKFAVTKQNLIQFEDEYDGSREWYILKQKTYGQAFCERFHITGPQSAMIELVTDSRVGRDIVRRWVDIYGT